MNKVLNALWSRPHLLLALAVGVITYLVSGVSEVRQVTRALVAWDWGIGTYIAISLFYMTGIPQETMKQRAIAHDEGANIILALTVAASVASVWALVAELSEAKGHPGSGGAVTLACITVVMSWFFVQIVFALRYAHVYYLDGGLKFGGDEPPDYWDFFHFAITLGAAAQTADICFTSRETRRLGTLHTLVAFGFNTAILATTINLAANLF